mmetsp:Transcript_37026/g.92998  ORF Transcript_37026/g.92998 Transcript_37026/m.92998 type:complete len:104 (+) Transcript_37026:1-312(+)
MGIHLKKSKEISKALQMYEKALQLLGPITPSSTKEIQLEAAPILINVGSAHLAMKQPEHAQPVLQQALDIRREHLGEDHKLTIAAAKWLAKCTDAPPPEAEET